jgi:hypothetical protein
MPEKALESETPALPSEAGPSSEPVVAAVLSEVDTRAKQAVANLAIKGLYKPGIDTSALPTLVTAIANETDPVALKTSIQTTMPLRTTARMRLCICYNRITSHSMLQPM